MEKIVKQLNSIWFLIMALGSIIYGYLAVNGVSSNAKLIYTAPFTQNVKVRITAGSIGGAANIALYQRNVGYPTTYVTIRAI